MLLQHLSSISCILMMIWWEYFFEREESSSQCRKSNQTTRPTSGLSQKRAAGLLKNTRHWPRFFCPDFQFFGLPFRWKHGRQLRGNVKSHWQWMGEATCSKILASQKKKLQRTICSVSFNIYLRFQWFGSSAQVFKAAELWLDAIKCYEIFLNNSVPPWCFLKKYCWT